jgi:hypothetical protein
MASRLGPTSEVAGGHTLPFFFKGHDLPILKMVWYVLLRPLRPELDGQDQVQIIVTQALNCSN